MRSAFRLCLDALNINHKVSSCTLVNARVCVRACLRQSAPELLSGLHHNKVPGVVDPLVQQTVPFLKKEKEKREERRRNDDTDFLAQIFLVHIS